MEERIQSSGDAKSNTLTTDIPHNKTTQQHNDDQFNEDDDNSRKDALDEGDSQLDDNDSNSRTNMSEYVTNDKEPPESNNDQAVTHLHGDEEEIDKLDLDDKQLIPQPNQAHEHNSQQQILKSQQSHRQQQQHQQTHIQLLMNALEKLDPDKNGLTQVTKEIVSSTLTTRLRAVSKINRLIDHSNDLCHSFHEIGAQTKFQENENKFKDWILRNKIIEHIFGPNCHVEIIKQSHTILNFVAYSLTDEHVNVIWSASTLKHCGRQVLDLLTSLIRCMRTGPVLHLYLLVKNLSPEDHSEHTLILTSHILRYIWLHSPCINQTGTDSSQPPEELKRSVVDHILKSISDTSSGPVSSQQNNNRHTLVGDAADSFADGSNDETPQTTRRRQTSTPRPCHQTDENSNVEDPEWLGQMKGNEFLDNASDLSACCSEDKNMDDFDDDAQDFVQPEDMADEVQDESSFNPNDPNDLYSSLAHRDTTKLIRDAINETPVRTSGVNSYNRGGSTPTSADSETKLTGSFDQNHPDLLHHLSSSGTIDEFKEKKLSLLNWSTFTRVSSDENVKALSEYNLINLNEPGKTLLWDLLQDEKIDQLAANLHIEVENVLVNLVMSFGDRCIRYRFIEACLENLSVGKSVIISMKLLPKFMSFNTVSRNLSRSAIEETHQWQSETHAIVLWAEKEYNMSKNFFKNLVEYYKDRQRLMDSRTSFTERQTYEVKDSILLRQTDELDEHDGKSSVFTHIEKLITRMSFLTFIYSKQFSPESMRLSKEQMDQLWDCLAYDCNLKCSDVLFQWIYQQAVTDDFHGVNDESLDYVLKYKLPTLPPEHFRLRGLKLLEQLLWIRQDYECCHSLDHPATKLLWDIALKAIDDELSMAAIRILNHFYVYTNHQKTIKCDKAVNFMRYCMDHLDSCLSDFNSCRDTKRISQKLDVMQRVILLIRTHLDVFRTHWSYYLRTLQINNEADLISHRFNVYEIKLTMTIRLVCQAASSMDKTTIEVQANDCIGEMRAEIVKWWYSQVDRSAYEQSTSFSPSSSSSSSTNASVSLTENNEDTSSNRRLQQHQKPHRSRKSSNDSSSLNSFTEFLLQNHHSLRLLSHQQEIPFEWDSRPINDLDLKDMQVVYVLNDTATNIDSGDDLASDKSNESSNLQHVSKSDIPSMLLLNHHYFERLMEADRILGSFRCDVQELTTRAKTLSRRVWEIIQILPTCPHYKEDLRLCGMPDNDWRLKTDRCSNLLNSECPQRLLYSLQIIDILRSSSNSSGWAAVFIGKGGLSDIYDVFMSQRLLPDDNEDWNEWLQECLAYLLKLLFQFGTRVRPASRNETMMAGSSNKFSSGLTICSNRIMTSNGSIKRIRRNRNRPIAAVEDRILLPHFSDELLVLLENTNLIFNKLIWILKSSALCRNQCDQYYYSAMTSRAMIVHHVMSFMSSWCKSDARFPDIRVEDYQGLLKALILDDTDVSTRREACHGFFKLHYACVTRSTSLFERIVDSTSVSSINSQTSVDSGLCQSETQTGRRVRYCQITNKYFSSDLLQSLIKFLPITEEMKPPKPIRNYASENEYMREMYSPGCKDYFWLLCRLLDSPHSVKLHKRPLISFEKSPQGKHERERTHTSQSERSPSPADNFTGVDLFKLCEYLVVAIRNRPVYESRDFTVEDDTLKGMLHLMVMSLKRDPTFRYTTLAYEFVHELFEYLFAPPTQKERFLPKCKATSTRSTAFDLMVALVEHCPKNYFRLLDLLFANQHNSVVKCSYPSDYWPHDECRSEVGFVGLINLGATCYLATCMQHLFMIPDLRYAILSIQDTKTIRHGEIIRELQKIFTFMLESERKAYNPRNFCKVYTMDNHPLNIAEQTDMTEFLTDLMTKLEESSLNLRQIIKGLFSGTLSNNVVSLDCPHISRTTEEFYTLRVQVADMRNLNDSLDELTVKDTLEGDNMYTCSTCEKKVRAEKRACIVKLPRILCFNTMRYTFNMVTMTKEKVNTHFSFPLKLDMADYLESVLMKRQQTPSNCANSNSSPRSSVASSSTTPTRATSDISNVASAKDEDTPSKDRCNQAEQTRNNESTGSTNESPTMSTSSESPSSVQSCGDDEDSETIYELIGVTVHTGNADGGHYYCFIRDCEDQSSEKPRWYLFNDAEVKPFDDSHIGTECYGGELTTKSYDAMNDRFVDFSIEKTNSAYMLFYKRVDYKYHSRSVALRYIESDTQRSTFNIPRPRCHNEHVQVCKNADTSPTDGFRDVESNPVLKDTAVLSKDNSSASSSSVAISFSKFGKNNYEDFTLPRHLENWIWSDNMKFARDKSIFEHNYFNFMWQICANVPDTLDCLPEDLMEAPLGDTSAQVSEDAIAIRTVHLAIAFVLGVLMNSRERPHLTLWTELIRKQFNTSQAACEWLMQLIDDEETWLKQMLMKCPIEMVKQLFQRLCNDLTGSKQHKKLRLVK